MSLNTDMETKPVQFTELWGKIITTDVIPSYTPKKVSEQITIYVSGATYRLYIYDFTNNAWRYTALT